MKTRRSLAKTCLAAWMFISYTGTYVLAAPRGGQVVSGTASFQTDGNLTTITAGNRSIINYQGFDIGRNETVRFVQPSASSTVLNRVTGLAPTNIFGQLQSNGIVYVVNPYGVYFQNGSVINVGGLYAAAGRISNEDFTAGRIHFTDLAGDVRNDGVLAADNRIALLGANVVNTGTLSSAHGVAMMVSGRDVFIGPKDGNIFVKANGAPASNTPAAGSVNNSGKVAAPRVLLGAGDMYSTAIVNSGLLQGKNISVNAGRNGTATVSGRLDASSATNSPKTGRGGTIQVTGGSVALHGARIDASGTKAGGNVRVGGDFHGGGTLARSTTTTADAATTVNVDGTSAKGTGGTAVLWSDSYTSFAGQISARGFTGGSVEVSSHDRLAYGGFTDLRPTASNGKAGSLLLDPLTITIVDDATTPPANTVPAPGDTLPFVPPTGTTPTPPDDATISATGLRLALVSGTLTLQAVNDINFNASVNTGLASTGSLVLQAGHNITFAAGVTLQMNGSLKATVRDPAANSTLFGGTFSMGAGSVIQARGGIDISGGSIQATTLRTDNTTAGFARGNIVLDSGTFTTDAAGNVIPANVTANTLSAANPFMTATQTGAISIFSGGSVKVNTAVNTSSVGGTASAFTVGPSTSYGVTPSGGVPAGPYQLPTDITVPVPNTAGSTAANSGLISLTTGGILAFVPPGSTPPPGPVTFTGNTTLTAEGVTNSALNGGGYDLSLTFSTQQVNLANVSNVNNFTSSGTAGTFAAANFATTGNQTYNNTLTLGNVVTLTSGGAIRFAGITNATPQSLFLSALGGVFFTQSVGSATSPLASVDVLNETNTTFQSTGALNVTTTDDQNYTGNVAFNTVSPTLTSTGSYVVLGSISGTASALTVNATDANVGAAGSSSFGGSLTFNLGTGALVFFSPVSAASVTRTGVGDTDLLGGFVTTTGGGQSYEGTAFLGADTTLQDTGGGAIHLFGAVDSDSDEGATTYGRTLTVLTNGTTTFGGALGSEYALGQLTVGNATTYNQGSTVFSIPGTGAAATTIRLGTATTGQQSYYGPVLLTQNTTLQSTTGNGAANGGDITFYSTIDTSGTTLRSLTVNTSGSEFFNGLIGSSGRLEGLATDQATGFVGGQAHFNMTLPTTLPTGTTVVAGVNTNFGGVTTGDQAVFNVANSSSAKVPTAVSGVTGINTPTMLTNGAQNYAGTVLLLQDAVFAGPTLTAGGISATSPAGLILDLSSQSVRVPFTITLTFPPITIPVNNFGAVTGISHFASVGNGGTVLGGGTFLTPGYQYYGNSASTLANVTLIADTTLVSGGNKNIGFGGKLDGAFNLTVGAGDGTVYFDGLVGSGTALTSITVNSPAVFDMTLTGQASGTAGVNVGVGGVTINGPVLFNVAGGSLTLPTIRTTGGQTYNGAGTLSADTVLASTGNGGLNFAGTVDSAANSPRRLTVNTGGTVTFGRQLGSIHPLLSLTTNLTGLGTTLFNVTVTDATAGTVTTVNPASGGTGVDGSQTYNGPVVLLTPTTLNGTVLLPGARGGDITFNNTVDAFVAAAGIKVPQPLTISTAGAVTFNGTVGVTSALLSLNVFSAYGTTFTLPGPLTLANGIAFINLGAGGLTLSGPTTFDLSGSDVTSLNHPTVFSVGPQTFNGAVTLQRDTLLYSNAGADITFNNTVDGAATLALNTQGREIFGGIIGGTTPLTGLMTDILLFNSNGTSAAAGRVEFNIDLSEEPTGTAAVNVGAGGLNLADGVLFNVSNASLANPTVLVLGGGTQTYGGTTSLAQDTFLIGDASAPPVAGVYSGGGAIRFAGNVSREDGATGGLPSLTIRTGAGTTTFTGPVSVNALDLTGALVSFGGVVSDLDLLSVAPNGGAVGGTIFLNSLSVPGYSIVTNDGQTYGSPVVLQGNILLRDTASGNITFTGTLNGPFALTTDTAGATTFGGAVGGSVGGALSSLTTTALGTTYINGGSVRTIFQNVGDTPGQTYNNPVRLGANTVLFDNSGAGILATIRLGSTVDSVSQGNPRSLDVAAYNVEFDGTVGGNAPLLSLSTVGANLTTLNAGTITTTQAQSYGSAAGNVASGAITLNAGTEISFLTAASFVNTATLTAGTDIRFAGIAGFTEVATLNAQTNIGFLGNATFANTATLNAGTGISFGALANFGGLTTLQSDGNIVFQDTATLAGPTTMTAGTDINFLSALNGANPATGSSTLTLIAPGVVLFGGAVGATPLTSLDVTAGTVRINGGLVDTILGQNYRGAVALGAATLLQSGSAGAIGNGTIRLGSTLDGAFALTINTGGLTQFNGKIGGTTALTSLTTDNNGRTGEGTVFQFDGATASNNAAGVNVSGAVTINDPVTFNVSNASAAHPTVQTNDGAQTYNNLATLAADAFLAAANGTISFGSTVNGAQALTINTAGQTSFAGAVGQGTALTSLSIIGTGPNASTLLGGGLITTTGAQTYANAVILLNQSASLNGDGTISFDSTIDGAQALTINTRGQTSFGGAIGQNTPLLSLSVTGIGRNASTLLGGGLINTTGAQTYANAVLLANRNAILTGGGAISFGSTVSTFDGIESLTVDTPGQVSFAGAVGQDTALATLSITNTSPTASTLLGGGLINTGGAQTYANAVTLANQEALLNSNRSSISFGSTIDGAQALTVNALGQTSFAGAIGQNTPLTSLEIIAANPNASTLLGGGLINTTGTQLYANAVTLINQDANLNGGGAINFLSTVDGARALTVNTPGRTSFSGAIGQNTVLTSLSVIGTGASASTLLGGGLINTTGAQSYANPITLADRDASLTSANPDGGVSFQDTVNGFFAFNVTSNGPILFKGAVGNLDGQALTALTTSGGGQLTFSNGRVTTSGLQRYGNAVQLGANGLFTSTGAGGISFNNTVDGSFALETVTAGSTSFGGGVGTNTALASLRITGGGATMLGAGVVSTNGEQLYGGGVNLTADATLNSADLTFGGTVSGAQNLTLNARGTALFNGAIGEGTALQSLTVNDAGGRLTLGANVGQVSTNDFQIYYVPTTLNGQQTGFVSRDGAITFQNTLDGAQAGASAVTIDAPATSAFNGDVGFGTSLAALTVTGPLSIGGEHVMTTGDQFYGGEVNAGPLASSGTRMTASDGNVIFQKVVTGSGDLFVSGNRIAARDNVTVSGNLDLESFSGSPLLLLGGRSYVSTNGSVFFNTASPGLTDPSATASTILFTSGGPVEIRGANFTMGYLQKIISLGSLDINVRGGTATVGDIAARNRLSIEANQVVLLSRPAGNDAASNGPNNGLNFVADNSIDFGNARIIFANTDSNHVANFITFNGNVRVNRVAGISLFKDPQVDSQFALIANLGDDELNNINIKTEALRQPVGGGSQALDIAAAISGALPDQKPLDLAVDVTISASEMEELKKLGIHPRLAQKSERGSGASKRALFAQLVDGEDPENYGRIQPIKGGISRLEPSDYVVVVDRMGEREVQSILKAFDGLYGKNKDKAPAIGTAFQDAFNAYTVEKQTADPSGFAAYLQGQPGKYPAVDTAIRGFDDLFGRIEHLGLTEKEVAKSEEHIASDLGVSGLSPEDLVKVINSARKKLTPAQKAASNKLPQAAPVSAGNPAPAASPAPAPTPAPANTTLPGAATMPPVAPATKTLPDSTTLPPVAPAVSPGPDAIPEIMAVPDDAAAPEASPAATPAPTPAPTPAATPAATPAPTPAPSPSASPAATAAPASKPPMTVQKSRAPRRANRPAGKLPARPRTPRPPPADKRPLSTPPNRHPLPDPTVDPLLEPISADAPCGVDLAYDVVYNDLAVAIQGTPDNQFEENSAKEPDWPAIRKLSEATLARSKDLQIAVYFTVSLMQTTGFAGAARGVELLSGFVRTYWDTLFPNLDPEDKDPTQRVNIVSQLAVEQGSFGDPIKFIERLQKAPIFKVPNLAVTIHYLTTEPTPGAGTGATKLPEIMASGDPEEVRTGVEALRRTVAAVHGMDDYFVQALGRGSAPSFDSLIKMLDKGLRLFEAYQPAAATTDATAPNAAAVPVGQAPAAAPAAPPVVVAGEIRSLDDVRKTLAKIREFYALHEPASPVPLLLRRAERLVGKSFLDLLTNLMPNSRNEFDTLLGPDSGENT